MGGGPQIPDRPREAYYGTGVVTSVEIKPSDWRTASVNFGTYLPPRENVHLLVVRTNAVIGKAKARWSGHSVWILEGTPQIGDLVVGIQHKKEFKEQQPSRQQ
jgi:hypothetical protein